MLGFPIETLVPWALLSVASLILLGIVRVCLTFLRISQSDMQNWGELTPEEEADGERADRRLTRLYWLAGFTGLATLVWIFRDRLFQSVPA